ncbi:putative ribonuclease H-like domain-containing protein [Tanacetum coccineum]|uniref:Ribonuclease H-like domain-containing protein n=1 Tax=Tanacetum coccineum TaxID=301880 RepID=A0ABQ5AG50_9ASTR
METSNDSVRNSEANDDPQKEQDGTANVSESNGNTNPTASSKDSLADQVEPVLSPYELPELPASPTVETVVPTVSTPIPTGSKFIPPITSSLPKIISRGGSSYSEPLSLEEPKKIIDALKDESWVEAMQEELLQFQIQNVWVLVDCPKGVRPIGTKWVLKNKKDERGIVIRNRIQAYGTRLHYMRFIVYQMYVKSAFLYGTIDEEVYVMQPPGFEDPEFPNKVYRVEKAMYGLHQAPRALYGTLSKHLLANGFQRGTIDQTLVHTEKHNGELFAVQVYVDDIIFGLSNLKLCREFEALMHDKFKMSAMGELTFFLGLQVLQKNDGIFISQDKYVGDILKKFGYTRYNNVADLLTKPFDVGRFQYLVAEHVMKRLLWCIKSGITSCYEPASPPRDYSHGEAFPTTTSLDAGQDGENIPKTSAMPHESSPRVTSLGGDEAVLQLTLTKLIGLLDQNCQSQHSLEVCKNPRVKIWKSPIKDQDKDYVGCSNDLERRSESTGEMANVLSSIGAANILASGGLKEVFTTASPPVPPVSLFVPTVAATASEKDSTAAVITTTTAVTPYTRRTRASRGLREQAARDAEIAKLHTEGELKMMIDELDRSNEVIAKHLKEYAQAKDVLSLEDKIELITKLAKYQKDLALINKYQAQQSKLASKTDRRKFYTSVLRSHAGWKTKDFKGMTFEPIEETFIPV